MHGQSRMPSAYFSLELKNGLKVRKKKGISFITSLPFSHDYFFSNTNDVSGDFSKSSSHQPTHSISGHSYSLPLFFWTVYYGKDFICMSSSPRSFGPPISTWLFLNQVIKGQSGLPGQAVGLFT